MIKKRIVFMGTPIFAAKVLEHLLTLPIEIVGVVTQTDKKVGRKHIVTPTPVKVVAQQAGLLVFQPVKVKDIVSQLQALEYDFIVTCAYGQFLPEVVLKSARIDALNIHASLLPKYRGGAPIHWAVINGETETGISLMRMVKAMDAGEVFAQTRVAITLEDTTSTLHDKLIEAAKACCDRYLLDVFEGKLKAIPQDEAKVTYGYNITGDNEHINFNTSAQVVYNHIRGLIHWPVGYATIQSLRFKFYGCVISDMLATHPPGTIERVDKSGVYVATQSYCVCITHIQVEGRKMYAVVDDVSYLQNYVHHMFE